MGGREVTSLFWSPQSLGGIQMGSWAYLHSIESPKDTERGGLGRRQGAIWGDGSDSCTPSTGGAPAQPPPPGLAGTPSTRHLGNGSYQASAKGAGAQPGSLPTSLTHGCADRRGQRTGSLWCGLGQRAAQQVGAGLLSPGALPLTADCPLDGLLSLVSCLCSPIRVSPSEFSFPVSFCFFFSPSSVSGLVCISVWVSCLFLAASLYFRLVCPTSSSSWPFPHFRPLSGAPSLTPSTHSSLHPRLAAPPWSQLLLPAVPELQGVGLSRGSEVGSGRGLGRAPPQLLWNVGGACPTTSRVGEPEPAGLNSPHTPHTPDATHRPRRKSTQPQTPTQGPLQPPDPDQPASLSGTHAQHTLCSQGVGNATQRPQYATPHTLKPTPAYTLAPQPQSTV